MEIAAVGRDEFVQGFKLAGVRKTYSVGREGLEQQVARVLEDPEVGILVLSSEDLEAMSPGMRRRLETTPRPVMIAVGRKEEEDLRAKIKRAIGVDLYK
jgi:V/A-type H+/Na+-transporting ATPase subunit F